VKERIGAPLVELHRVPNHGGITVFSHGCEDLAYDGLDVREVGLATIIESRERLVSGYCAVVNDWKHRRARVYQLLPLLCILGCPSVPCAPADKGGHCTTIVCPTGAHVEKQSCVCVEGSTLVAGACVPFALADTFCGRAATPQPGGGCARKKCAAGEALELDHGLCIPESVVRSSMSHGVLDAEDTRRPTCLFGVLVSHGPGTQLGCAMGPSSCPRGEHFVKAIVDAGSPGLAGVCEPTPACGAGEVFDATFSKCARVVRESSGATVVDVGAWARLALGVDGAEGTDAFCAPVRATQARGRFQLELAFPDNDVTRASARLTPLPGTPLPASDAAEQSLQLLIQALRYYGGASSAASVSLEVGCNPGMAATPMLEVLKTVGDAGR
jgi:hypothetical protein